MIAATMQDLHVAILIVHFVGLAFGVGIATATDIVFVTSVRKRYVNHTLESIMETLSSVVMVGFVILVLSGIGLVLTGTDPTQRFWAKQVMVIVVGINGLFAHRFTFPHLSAKMKSRCTDVTVAFLHQLSATAAISAVSWYGAIVAGTWKSSPWNFGVWIAVYLVVLFASVVGSLFVTPFLLHVDHPDFHDAFPTVAGWSEAADRANVWRRSETGAGQQN